MKTIVLFVALAIAGGVAAADPTAAPTTPPALQQQCRDALNADPAFAKQVADKFQLQIEQKTLDAQLDADKRIKENKAHVIYAYAALWVIAAVFVIFLFFRQQGLKAEIAGLRKDLEAAAK